MQQEINRIMAMEGILENQTVLVHELNQLLDQIEETHSNLVKLRTSKPREASSYGSEEFHHDVEMHQQGKFPDDLDRLVLSEDGIYNVITGHYQTAIRMIELATQKLKDY